jgi:hypothetical protein
MVRADLFNLVDEKRPLMSEGRLLFYFVLQVEFITTQRYSSCYTRSRRTALSLNGDRILGLESQGESA